MVNKNMQLENIKSQLEQEGFQQLVIPNDREMEYARKTNTLGLIQRPFIIKIKRYDEKNIGSLNSVTETNITNDFNATIEEFQDSEVITLFQLNKGIRKERFIGIMEGSQINSNSNNVTLQETDIKQDENDLGIQIDNFKNIIKNKNIYLVLEIESKRIEEKVNIAISKGIRNFILRAGNYNNIELWSALISKIHSEDRVVFISLPTRYDKNTKISYIQMFVRLGADFIFHEVYRGWEGVELLHLNEGFIYVRMSINQAMLIYEENIRRDFEDRIIGNDGLHYGFSRVRAISLSNSIIPFLEHF